MGAVVRSVDLSTLAEATYLFEQRQEFLSPYLDNTTALQGDFGLMYHFGRFNVGLSLPELFAASPIATDPFTSPAFRPWNNIIFKTYYRHSFLDDKLAIDPNILYKYSAAGNSQYEFTMLLHILHWIWTGVSFRQDVGYIGLAGAKFNHRLAFGLRPRLCEQQLGKLCSCGHATKYIWAYIWARAEIMWNTHIRSSEAIYPTKMTPPSLP